MKTTKYWTMVKEFHGVQLLRDPESLQSRITPIERPQPQQKPEPQISPEMLRRAEASYDACKARKQAVLVTTLTQPEPALMSFEEQIAHDWRFNLGGIRKEFVSQASYEAYMKAEKAGRARFCGKV